MEQLVINSDTFKILSLDGGGSKGVYTIGILKEVEQLVGKPLHEHFDLMFGTSTGSIIISLLSLGYSVSDIDKLYFDIIPDIMGKSNRAKRSKALKYHAYSLFGEKEFDEFKSYIGIVATNCENNLPMIFKSSVKQAHGRQGTFKAGFGATIADAVRGSCAAFPFFDKVKIRTVNQNHPTLLDGGFVANNPTLFAIIDAKKALKIGEDNIKVLSLGTGNFPEKNIGLKDMIDLKRIKATALEIGKQTIYSMPIEILQTTLSASANTSEQMRKLIYPNVDTVRINESYSNAALATDLLENDINKLREIQNKGRDSFAKYESQIIQLFS